MSKKATLILEYSLCMFLHVYVAYLFCLKCFSKGPCTHETAPNLLRQGFSCRCVSLGLGGVSF